MELKEIEKQIQLLTGCSSLEAGTIMIFIQNYGQSQYNAAIDKAAECAETTDDYGNPYDPDSWFKVVDRQSILNLKIPTK